ncbi:hypothetical protein AKJ47_03080 [candidate division MSBL1 archaeon SCGC-AAA261G05]|uniref:Polysaccharide biosynthesis protein C-terminal domain-containing protein n=1 Tax=candidate division MSBL1 archaeon SCGC-AAA261G05 TaxID=1698276 RepID=A0A133V929_9EURY|nr:hypothetical protein AKJ47_03080 [candidate division MSBL1 archaeon SCGC-AAA261G05]
MSDNTNQHMERLLPKIAKGAGIVFIGMILGRVAGYLSRLVIARGLGPEPYGLISLGLAAVSIAGVVGMLGLRSGTTRHISLYKGRGDERGIKGVITSSLKVTFPLSLLLGVLLFLFSGWISVHLFHEPGLSGVLKIMAAILPISGIAGVLLSALTGFQRMDYLVYSRNFVEYFSRATLIAFFIFLGYGILGAALAYVIAPVLGTLKSRKKRQEPRDNR